MPEGAVRHQLETPDTHDVVNTRRRDEDPPDLCFVMDPSRGPASRRHETGDAVETPDPRSTWAQFLSWLECVCVVTFDLELGQAIEVQWLACISILPWP